MERSSAAVVAPFLVKSSEKSSENARFWEKMSVFRRKC